MVWFGNLFFYFLLYFTVKYLLTFPLSKKKLHNVLQMYNMLQYELGAVFEIHISIRAMVMVLVCTNYGIHFYTII